MCAGLFGAFLFIAGALVPSAPLSGPPSTSTYTVSDQYVRDTPTATDSIALEQGWNLVSSRIIPDAPALEDVFADVAPSIVEVRDEQDRVYRPGEVNEIGDWNAREGYEVYASSPQTLVLEGTPLAREAKISLDQGWNTISYLPDVPLPVAEALSSIDNAVMMVKNGRGDAYIPSEGVNRIGQLAPKEAYKINVSQDIELSYPSGSRTYAAECLRQRNAVVPRDFGSFVADTPSDSLQRVANAQSLNAAIDDVPVGGTVCLPEGDYYVLPTTPLSEDPTSIRIERDSVTVWGAGRNDNGNGTGLHTRGEYSVIDGSVKRGAGIGLYANRATGDEIDGVVLRDFELDGNVENGHTGSYGWPADPEDGGGWDISHKGLFLSKGGATNEVNVEVRRIWVHSYRGEQIYYGGNSLGTAIFDDILSEDTNASTINVAGDSVVVKNSEFGLSRFWVEIGPKQPEDYGRYANNYFHDAAKKKAFAFSAGADYVDEYIVEDNTFEDCNFGESPSGQLFQFTGAIQGSFMIHNNTMINCGGAIFTRTDAAEGGPTRDVTIKNNDIQTKGKAVFYFFTSSKDVVIKDNTVTVNLPQSKPNSLTPLTAWGGSSKDSVRVINNNITEGPGFRGIERFSLGSGNKRPLHLQNEYTNSAGATVHEISAADSLADPFVETALLRPTESSVEVTLGTEHTPDGQITTFISQDDDGPSGAEVVFSPSNPTYDVSEERRLTNGQTITLEYDESAGTWVEIQ
ncbi:right-handed parallel beta-helix repeat-containing protein [Salinibacter ruber]|uniref:right-handed parallel beta-helix repeat-containing protein n=1 Tax=Salinibacter ruber TaxID=146919 RepID=UPI0021674CF1|nr:right-handed parallel beta-helix repeat-containing protein [Salinibacter ruber]MCS3642388.1 hypothetical protein [Salinibacter ruber]